MKKNKTKQKLNNREPVHGVISSHRDAIIPELLGLLGFDFYMIDGEHGAVTLNDVENIVRACEIADITPLARIRSNDPKLVLQFLDLGIMGIMMPGLMNIGDVQTFVGGALYPPLGQRGLGPIRAADYMQGKQSQAAYVNFANEQLLILPQFEDVRALDELEAMTRVDGVDGFIIGPRDLAMSMGFTDGPKHSEVQEVIDIAFETVVSAGLTAGSVAGTPESAKVLISKGALFCLNSVPNLIVSSGRAYLSGVR
jgi:4-hydroxy-2-oxoheptanedioate aldolase